MRIALRHSIAQHLITIKQDEHLKEPQHSLAPPARDELTDVEMVGERERARKSFYIVRVPADGEQQLEEWEVALPADKDAQLGCLTERLRAHFKQMSSSSAGNSESKQQEIFKQQLLSQLPKGATMTDDMLQMMLGMDSLVDSFPLMLNTRAVSHIGVNMYVDDKGTAKGLATNVRASAIAQACGKMIEVRGDAFIARVFDNGASRCVAITLRWLCEWRGATD